MKQILILALASMGLVASAETQHSFFTRPDVHGDLVVFTCEGDLWLGNVETHEAKRITGDPGTETNARFSPDGSMIAFTASYDGNPDVYVMPTQGGAPVRLTFDAKGASVIGWTPDGKNVIFRSRRQLPHRDSRKLYTVPVAGGQAVRLAIPQGEFASWGPAGLAYVPVSNEWANWFRYRAGAADKVWLTDLHGHFTKLTNEPTVDTTPVWSGNDLFIVSERTGVSNLYQLNPTSKAVTQITKFRDYPVRYPGADSNRVVFQHGPGLAIYDKRSGKVSNLSFTLNSDRIHAREQRIPLRASLGHVSIGPTGKRLALESRGQIVSVAAENGDLRILENKPGTRSQMPVWSPDGRKVAFVSDRSGENELWVSDTTVGGEPTQLTRGIKANPFPPIWAPGGANLLIGDRDGRIILVDAASGAMKVIDQTPFVGSYNYTTNYTFSADGKYAAFEHTPPTGISQIWIYDIATDKKAQVSHTDVNSGNPAFTPDGKFLAFTADMSLSPSFGFTHKYSFSNVTKVLMCALSKDTPSPFLPKTDEEYTPPAPTPSQPNPQAPAVVTRVDMDSISNRLIETSIPGGTYYALLAVPGKLILGSADGNIMGFAIDSKMFAPVLPGARLIDRSADGKRLLVNGPTGFAVVDVAAPAPKVVDLSPYTITIQPEKEWHQIFEESWRIARDFFYDPNMHGVNWNEVHQRYAGQVDMVGDRADLTRLLQDMVSELNSGHAYIVDPTPPGTRIPMGFLGADYESVPGTDAVRITKLYRGDDFTVEGRSPLLDPGVNVKEGDYILAVAGQPVKRDQDVQSLLIGQVRQTIAVTVNDKPTMAGARTIRVRPLTSEDALRYSDWVANRTEYVRKYGGENLGYLHVPDMSAGGVVGFTKGQFPNVLKEGMVYDFRFNGGGFVSSLLLENIAAKPQAWWSPRWGAFWTRENWANVGYAVALCNEFNFSDGELVIEAWKKMKLGPVIGKTTGGGEVGSGAGYRLIDEGQIYVPNYAAFSDGKWLVEGVGAKPDIEVEEDPNAVIAGRDPQLDKAIEVLKARIAKNPVKAPVRPSYPNKALGGG